MTFPFETFLLLTITSAYTPGPNNIMCMTLGQNIAFKKSCRFVFGAFVGNFCITSLIVMFNSFFVKYFPSVSGVFKIIGALYLLYMAGSILYKTFFSSKDSKFVSPIPEDKLFVTAIFLQFINPKSVLFGFSIFSVYVIPYFTSPLQLYGLALLRAVIVLSALMLWTVSGAILHVFIKNNEKIFNICMAILLAYCAILILA